MGADRLAKRAVAREIAEDIGEVEKAVGHGRGVTAGAIK